MEVAAIEWTQELFQDKFEAFAKSVHAVYIVQHPTAQTQASVNRLTEKS
jgi:hypothetical protein